MSDRDSGFGSGLGADKAAKIVAVDWATSASPPSRIKAERASRQTRAERESKRPKRRSKTLTFKTTPEMSSFIDGVAKQLGITKTAAIERGIQLLAKQNRIKRHEVG